VKLADLRGDGAKDSGMIGLCPAYLGWTRRPSAQTNAGMDVFSADKRFGWWFQSDPRSILASELGNYYFALPEVTNI
jgi:hypothetical protein